MKFAKYLKDTRTPEWKNAYIDYSGLKKLITAIRKAQEESGELHPIVETTEADGNTVRAPVAGLSPTSKDTHGRSSYGSTGRSPALVVRSPAFENPPPVELPEPALPFTEEVASSSRILDRQRVLAKKPAAMRSHTDVGAIRSRSQRSLSTQHGSAQHPSPPVVQGSPGTFLAALRRKSTHRQNPTGSASSRGRVTMPLMVIVAMLTPLEREFMDMLDHELEKVEKFYLAREQEAKQRSHVLKVQLRELQDHRRLFHATKASENGWAPLIVSRSVAGRFPDVHIPKALRPLSVSKRKSKGDSPTATTPEEQTSSRSSSPIVGRHGNDLDPDEYKHAKKNLKRAILEHYRYLELLQNYRVLNLTGFRKALKKFEKIAKVTVQQAYMQEKVETSAFASGEVIEKLLAETETLYSTSFEYGNLKQARARLRSTAKDKTHHYSTFRSGLYLGIAVPALIEGVYKSFQPEVRDAIPWDALLYVYATFLVPVLFSLLVGINIWTWNRNRINYQFIFELDVRTQLDFRQYFELPAFLLSTLIYAFWLSFTLTGNEQVAPTTWPLAWLVLTLILLWDPLPIFFQYSRWWLTRKTGKLLISGTKAVEFTDFWLGDQFCSLMFSLANLYFFACVYKQDWNGDLWTTCSMSVHWPVPFVLGALPLIIRAVQSVKRYIDSRLYTHLINGGKYCSSILYFGFYYYWRHRNMAKDHSLVLFCIFGTIASVYTCSWDFLMDWSLFKRPAQRPFLRQTLIYHNYYFVYYVAMVFNLLIRFIWILYVVDMEMSIQTRSFIVAMLEMLRRLQWNFFRLENEHIGNTDQYRATREVPLPYRLDDAEREDESEDEAEDEAKSSRRSMRSVWTRSPPGRDAPRPQQQAAVTNRDLGAGADAEQQL